MFRVFPGWVLSDEQMNEWAKEGAVFLLPKKNRAVSCCKMVTVLRHFQLRSYPKYKTFAQWYYYRISRCLLGGLMLMVKPWHAFFQCVSYKCLHPFHTGVPTQNILYTTNHWIERDTISGILLFFVNAGQWYTLDIFIYILFKMMLHIHRKNTSLYTRKISCN